VRWIRLIDKSDAPLHYSDQAAAAGHDGGRGALFALARLGAPARWPVMGAANIHKPCALAARSRPDHPGTLPPAAGGGRPIVGASSISKSPGRGYLGNYKNRRAAQIRTEHAMAKNQGLFELERNCSASLILRVCADQAKSASSGSSSHSSICVAAIVLFGK